jgi:hypothetical protein
MSRTSDMIKYEKIREVYQFMINVSKQSKEIVHFFSTKWDEENFFKEGISDLSKQRTIFNYIKKVKLTFMNFENDVEVEKGRQLARLEDLYTKNIKIQDYKAAKDIVKEINVMLGLNNPIKTELSGEIKTQETDISKLSIEDQKAYGLLRLKSKGIND